MDEVKPQWMANHEQSDLMQFESIHMAIAELPTKKDLENLATKDDVKPMLALYNNFVLGGKILEGGSKWTWRTMIMIAAIITVMGIITGGLKGVLAGLLAWGSTSN